MYTQKDLEYWESLLEARKKDRVKDRYAMRTCYIKIVAIKKELSCNKKDR